MWSISIRSIYLFKSPYFNKFHQKALLETRMQNLWNWPLLFCFCLFANTIIHVSFSLNLIESLIRLWNVLFAYLDVSGIRVSGTVGARIPNTFGIQMVHRVLWHWRFRHWRLWHWRPRHWRFFGDIGGFVKKRHWRPGDIGGLLTLEAQPSRGAGKNIPKKGNICWCEAFVIPVARETHVARLNGLRSRC